MNELETTHMDEFKQFEVLSEKAKKAIYSLPAVVGDAIYYDNKDETLPAPEAFDKLRWAEINEANDLNMLNVFDGEPIELNKDHPKVSKTYRTIDQLRDFMSKHEGAMQGLIEDKYEVTFNLTDRGFWNQFIG